MALLSNDALMRRALHEARKSTHKVRPNPRVGCVIELPSGELIEGHHEIWGGPHAERVALNKLEKLYPSKTARGARVAVTLEPCSHTGKTPPCADALIQAGVSEVLIPFVDPNPLVAGKGVEQLRNAGITVHIGECQSEAYHLNREWLWTRVLGRPFVTLKIASSKNGVGVASDRKWITSPKARQHAMILRARVDALISSGETLRQDDPLLTSRDENEQLFEQQPRVIVFSKSRNLGTSTKILQHPRWEWHESSDLLASLKSFAHDGIFDVMVEVGPQLAEQFLKSGLVDEVWHYQAQVQLEGKSFLTEFNDFELVEESQIDESNVFLKYLSKERSEEKYFAKQPAG